MIWIKIYLFDRTNVSSTVKTESLDSNSNCDRSDSLNLNKSFTEKVDSWGIIKMADFPLVDGSRQHFWKESFVKNLMLVRSMKMNIFPSLKPFLGC